ncbi:MAG: hypothetical protein KKB31_04435 [Nanoarchaeota archaeon]|nr:hypothetical protein [Nanoarchaeota archaeon]
MCKFNKKSGNKRIDTCIRNFIKVINTSTIVKTLGSCCGHKKYPITVVVEFKNKMSQSEGGLFFPFELISGKVIPRKKRFYKRDKDGVYYIPEVINKK